MQLLIMFVFRFSDFPDFSDLSGFLFFPGSDRGPPKTLPTIGACGPLELPQTILR